MIEASVYRGIEFIRISELPADQKKLIREWAVNGTIIKILIEKSLLSDCVQYKDYCFWYKNVYKGIAETKQVTEINKKSAASIKLALGR